MCVINTYIMYLNIRLTAFVHCRFFFHKQLLTLLTCSCAEKRHMTRVSIGF